jgi:hypothetical protein
VCSLTELLLCDNIKCFIYTSFECIKSCLKDVKVFILLMTIIVGTVLGADLDEQAYKKSDLALQEYGDLFAACECMSLFEGLSEIDLIRQKYNLQDLDYKKSKDLFLLLAQIKDKNGDFLFEGVRKKREQDPESNSFCATVYQEYLDHTKVYGQCNGFSDDKQVG